MRQLVYQVCSTRYQASFYLWQLGPVLKHCKVPKYYDQDCSCYWSTEIFSHIFKNITCPQWMKYIQRWYSTFLNKSEISSGNIVLLPLTLMWSKCQALPSVLSFVFQRVLFAGQACFNGLICPLYVFGKIFCIIHFL